MTSREYYRGVLIQDHQPQTRVEGRVRLAIDQVMKMTAIADLLRYCGDVSGPPEARLLAGEMLEAIYEQSAADRTSRPDIDLVMVHAMTAGLEEDSPWRSPWSYGCIAGDCPGSGRPQPDKRPVELSDEQLGIR
jgi:hypothetical protein